MLTLPSFEELQQFVLGVLCRRADLEESTPLLDATLFRRGAPCGIEYLLLGPRSIRLSAVWAVEEKRILFYDVDLSRFQITAVEGPSAAEIAQRKRGGLKLQSMWKGK